MQKDQLTVLVTSALQERDRLRRFVSACATRSSPEYRQKSRLPSVREPFFYVSEQFLACCNEEKEVRSLLDPSDPEEEIRLRDMDSGTQQYIYFADLPSVLENMSGIHRPFEDEDG